MGEHREDGDEGHKMPDSTVEVNPSEDKTKVQEIVDDDGNPVDPDEIDDAEEVDDDEDTDAGNEA